MCDTNQVGPVPNVDFKLLKISCHEQTLNGYQGIRKHKSFVFSSAKTCMSFCWASQEATECKHSTWTFVVFFSSSLRDISKDNLKISWRITWQGTAWRCASLRPLLLQRQPITNDYHKAAGPGLVNLHWLLLPWRNSRRITTVCMCGDRVCGHGKGSSRRQVSAPFSRTLYVNTL